MKLKANNIALSENRTIHVKMVLSPKHHRTLLKSAEHNAKLGKGRNRVTRGPWRGMPMYSLTLQERATCPTSCQRWRECFGNNMRLAKRIDHSARSFLPILRRELAELAAKHPSGFVVRLHVLGDFFSVGYVEFWRSMLAAHEALHIFGYTHRKRGTAIGNAVRAVRAEYGQRFSVRASDSNETFSANVVTLAAARAHEGGSGAPIVCPEQTGKTASCLTCGLCWGAQDRGILFIDHDQKTAAKRAA